MTWPQLINHYDCHLKESYSSGLELLTQLIGLLNIAGVSFWGLNCWGHHTFKDSAAVAATYSRAWQKCGVPPTAESLNVWPP